MHTLLLLSAAIVLQVPAHRPGEAELVRWKRESRAVTIVRDDWGIAHVHGKTDADAVFGMIYAQAEDDFNRVETNYLNSIGRLAEAEGESAVWQDLRMKLFIDPDSMRARYAASPDWLKRLMNAWADGLNYYLHTHPDVKPRVITRFEPWMPLSFSEGSIGADFENVSLEELERFYGDSASRPSPTDDERTAKGDGFERFRHRPVQHRQPPSAPSHQPAYDLLLSLRAPDEKRRGARRLRRRHVGAIFPLSGLQRPTRMDAYLDRCRRGR